MDHMLHHTGIVLLCFVLLVGAFCLSLPPFADTVPCLPASWHREDARSPRRLQRDNLVSLRRQYCLLRSLQRSTHISTCTHISRVISRVMWRFAQIYGKSNQ